MLEHVTLLIKFEILPPAGAWESLRHYLLCKEQFELLTFDLLQPTLSRVTASRRLYEFN
jgi:hypothetical protein